MQSILKGYFLIHKKYLRVFVLWAVEGLNEPTTIAEDPLR